MEELSRRGLRVMMQDDTHVIAVATPTAVEQYWPQVRQLLEVNPDTWAYGHTIDSIRSLIDSGNLLLWLVLRGTHVCMATLTEWEFFPKLRVLRVVWGAGAELDKFLPLAVSTMELMVQQNGGGAVAVTGREGFKRKFTPFGFKVLNVTMFKQVNAERAN